MFRRVFNYIDFPLSTQVFKKPVATDFQRAQPLEQGTRTIVALASIGCMAAGSTPEILSAIAYDAGYGRGLRLGFDSS
jgi:hypothetical protein